MCLLRTTWAPVFVLSLNAFQENLDYIYLFCFKAFWGYRTVLQPTVFQAAWLLNTTVCLSELISTMRSQWNLSRCGRRPAPRKRSQVGIDVSAECETARLHWRVFVTERAGCCSVAGVRSVVNRSNYIQTMAAIMNSNTVPGKFSLAHTVHCSVCPVL